MARRTGKRSLATAVLRGRGRRRPFSLVELLLTMGILVILIMILFRFFANLQTAWSASMNTTELYESARATLDVVTRDLRSALATSDDIPGEHIRFDQPDAQSLWLVTAGEPPEGASCGLVEIGYRWQDQQFQRAFVDDTSSAWNIYGYRDDAADQAGYHSVVDAVMALEFICYDASMQAYTPSNATELPNVVSVALTLMDQHSYRLWQRLPTDRQAALEQKACRTFRKSIFLGGWSN